MVENMVMTPVKVSPLRVLWWATGIPWLIELIECINS